ncbi:MAG: DnaJ domain-containing protein [Synergistaceae bacterium]|nr:DnaJ domain-containing protein [Synergistaceae bacterium]MBQ6909486.1 DnaJ domain-containing protein [Synergistaceae bacterium]MBQ9897252.1 DnaJ domain-containing protein [Synergistaceae bacterium]MBR0043762.1 DnaJ domain-containing protein [Synergistaceae bacterium]MBR0097746.1 DnaJ domain-containing protein [Synergistaceae bacterium]
MKKEFDDLNEIKLKIKSSLRTLELEPDASPDEIKTAFKKLAKIYHPDVAAPKDAWRFQQITGAYSLLKNLNFLENLDLDNLKLEDLENNNFNESAASRDDKADASEEQDEASASAKAKSNFKDDEAKAKARNKNFELKLDKILTRCEDEINNYINKSEEISKRKLEERQQELKDNIIFRLNSQLKEVRNIAIKRTGNLINRDDVRQTLINLILNHDLDSETSRLIEMLPMNDDTRERIASSVCEKSENFSSTLIIKLLDLRNLNNLNLELIERYILCASPENLSLILRYWPKNKILSETALNNLLRSDDANILVPVLSSIKQNFPQEALKHNKRILELSAHESPAVRAWCRMLLPKQDL